MASQPLGGKTPETWITDFLNGFDGGCGPAREQVAIGGMSGVICAADLFATTAGDRGYFVRLYTGSEIPAEWVDLYDETWFKSVLSTLELHPEAALDTPARIVGFAVELRIRQGRRQTPARRRPVAGRPVAGLPSGAVEHHMFRLTAEPTFCRRL
jgi:hypothetical protein